jgi:hypothetical protein
MDTDLICWLSNHMQIISLGIIKIIEIKAPFSYWALNFSLNTKRSLNSRLYKPNMSNIDFQ